ncbi:hypothetical protein ACFY30_06150 [Streptomyces sp. NPDC000345]|uniref:hypothetical protein n=1 Tax=Streptomyces sp. NPDC000345 TaxID=3364537 RepID=UPI00367EE476
MRRTAPLLLAAALLVAAGPVAVADPAAEVGPGSVDPGGSVTVSVSCDPLDGTAPDTLDAVSQAFADGTVKLNKVPGDDGKTAGPAYEGSAHIASDLGEADGGVGPDTAWTVDGTCPAPPGGQGSPWSATFDVNRADGVGGGSGADSGTGADGGSDTYGGLAGSDTDDGIAGGDTDDGIVGSGSGTDNGLAGSGTVPQPCGPAHVPGGPSCDTGHTCSQAASCDTGHACSQPTSCATARPPAHATTPATVEHGVRAGTGGAFRESVPALVAGGLLIAGACGAAAHRLLRRRRPTADV